MQDRILSPLFMRQRTSVPYSPLTAGGTGQCCEVGGQAWAGMVTLPSGSVRATCACHGLISVKYPRALGRAEVHPENRDLGFGSPPAVCWALSATRRASCLLPAEWVLWALQAESTRLAQTVLSWWLEPTQLALFLFSFPPCFPSGLVIVSANCPVPKAEGRGEKNNVILEHVSDTQKGTPAHGFSCEVWPLNWFSCRF